MIEQRLLISLFEFRGRPKLLKNQIKFFKSTKLNSGFYYFSWWLVENY